MNLLYLNSILRKRDDMVSYPDAMAAQEAVSIVNSLIDQAHADVQPQVPRDATVGHVENLVHARLVKLMAEQGFKIVRVTQLPQAKQWNRVP